MPTDTDEELEQDQDEQKKPKPNVIGPIGKPLAPSPVNPDTANLSPIGGPPPAAVGGQEPPQVPQPFPTPDQASIGKPLTPTPQPAIPQPPQYHGLNRVLDTIAGATNIGTAIERAGGLGTQGYNQKVSDELGREKSQAEIEEAQARGEQAKAAGAAETTRANTAAEAAKNVTVTLPAELGGGTLNIPAGKEEDFLKEITRQIGSNKRTGETNQTKENIATQGNETKTNIATQGNETKETIAQWANKSRERIAQQANQVKEDIAKANSGKVAPWVAREAGTYEDSYERLKIMQQNLEDGVNKGDQQAMLSLLANHMGMTLGTVKNMRNGKAFIDEAQQSAPWLSRVEAHFDDNGYLTGVVLSPDQMQSMVSLAQNRFQLDQERFHNLQTFAGSQGGPSFNPSNESAPQRPANVPENYNWNPQVKRWQPPKK